MVGWFWYLGTLVPVLGIVQAGIQTMADRFTYIPQIGISIMMIYGISTILNRRPIIKMALIPMGAFIILTFAYLTSHRVERWRNSITLFTRTLNHTSKNHIIHNNLGATLMRQGKYQEAEMHFNKAIEIKPTYADAHYNLGTISYLQNHLETAFHYLSYALKLSPEKSETHNMMGEFLKSGGD